MNTAVVYASKYGHTKQYAEWIAQALGADLLEIAQTIPQALAVYDAIVYGGPLYAGQIKGVKRIKQNLDALAGKSLAIFTVGLTPPEASAAIEAVWQNAFPTRSEGMAFFHLRGGIDPARLTLAHRMVFGMVKRMQASGKTPNPMIQLPETAGNKPVSYVRREAVAPIVQYIRGE